MGCTPDDLIRLLPKVLKSHATVIDKYKRRAKITDGESSVVVDFETMPDRRLGSLTLPVTRVNISFQGYTETQAREFMARFDRSFLRMGGG